VSARRGGASWTPARAPPLRVPEILRQRPLQAVEDQARFPDPAGLPGEPRRCRPARLPAPAPLGLRREGRRAGPVQRPGALLPGPPGRRPLSGVRVQPDDGAVGAAAGSADAVAARTRGRVPRVRSGRVTGVRDVALLPVPPPRQRDDEESKITGEAFPSFRRE
jgi:hypothetical protein